ncbi:MAG: hypothetical protein IH614_14440 [Desulfuromonadales bacterium]|nr:hypothetical protein [Desulfuromonadales bacterium]
MSVLTKVMVNQNDYVVEDAYAMSTHDSYFWIKMTKDYDIASAGGEPGKTRGYPDLKQYTQPNLLVLLISKVKLITGLDYYKSGLVLIPILSSLFIFPLYVYFNRLGFGASAVLGSMIGTFSTTYYERTRIGYVDTDLLNTFFLITIACFILYMGKENNFRNSLLAIGSGLAMFLMNWWYQQPGLMVPFLFVMCIYLLWQKVEIRHIMFLIILSLVFSGPEYIRMMGTSLQEFYRAYFDPNLNQGINWPDIMSGISEARRLGPIETLRKIYYLPISVAGLLGILYLYQCRTREMMPITPVVLVGLWSLVGPNRFAMYLAPFIGIGVGVLVEVAWRQLSRIKKLPQPTISFCQITSMAIIFFATFDMATVNKLPATSIPVATVKSILEIKELVPERSTMLTWWDYGYPLMDIGHFSTYHDGSLHGGARTTLVAKVMMSPHQREMTALVSFLEENDFSTIHRLIRDRHLSGDQLVSAAFSYPGPLNGENLYVLYTYDMIAKFYELSKFGTWEFTNRKSSPFGYEELMCFGERGLFLECDDGEIDLRKGIFYYAGLKYYLNSVNYVDNGHLVYHLQYDSQEDGHIQIIMKNREVIMVQFINDKLYKSNFNQQYLLGNFDRSNFEEIYNNFPVARAFKIKDKKKPAKTSSTNDRPT